MVCLVVWIGCPRRKNSETAHHMRGKTFAKWKSRNRNSAAEYLDALSSESLLDSLWTVPTSRSSGRDSAPFCNPPSSQHGRHLHANTVLAAMTVRWMVHCLETKIHHVCYSVNPIEG